MRASMWTRALSVLLSAIMSLWLVPSAAMAGPPAALEWAAPQDVRALTFGAQGVRVQGTTRFGTSVAISQNGWQASQWVVVASARNWPDALVAGPLAAALDAPILLSEPDGLPSEVASEVARLGAVNALVIGGPAALGDQVLDDLATAGVPAGGIERIGGSDRYETSRLVAQRIEQILGEARSVVLATGERYPDALAASGFAGAQGMPILLTRGGSLPPATLLALQDLDVIATLVLGGTRAISEGVEALVPHPTRIGGSDRYDTARLIAEYAFANGFTYETIIIATGASFADALCAGAWAAAIGAPVVLTGGGELSPAAEEFLNSHCTSIKDILVIGGTAAISDEVVTDIEAAAITEISPETELVTEAMDTALETITPDGTLVFDASSPEVASIETSDVLVSGPTDAAPSGFLVRALSVEESGGQVTVETTMATLADVVEKGSLDVTGSVDPNADDSESSDLLMTGATTADGSHVDLQFDTSAGSAFVPTRELGLLSASGPSAQADMGGSVTMPFGTGLDDAGECTNATSAPVVVGGDVTFSGGFALNASWGHLYYVQQWWGKESITGLQNLTFTTYLSEAMRFDLDVNRDVAYTLDVIKQIEKKKQKTDPTYRFRIKIGSPWFWVGWVPVNVTFYVTPIAKLTVGTTGFHFGFQQSTSITLGVRYDYGSGWRPVVGATNNFSVRGPTLDGGACTVTVGATVDCLFYDVLGPYFGATGALGIRSDVAANPWWSASAAVDGLYGGKLDVLGKSFSLNGSTPIFRRVIAKAPGSYPASGTVWWPSGAGVASAGGPAAAGTPLLDMSTVEPEDFAIEGLDVTGVSQLPDGTVRLTTSPQARHQDYVVRVTDDAFRTDDGVWVVGSSAGFFAFTPPEIVSAGALDANTLEVAFDAATTLDPASVQAGDFTVPGLFVASALLAPDGSTVVLTTSRQSDVVTYTVGVTTAALSGVEGFPSAASSADVGGFRPPGEVAGGGYFSAAITSGGDLLMWGVNDSGQLGDGTAVTRTTPNAVAPSGVWREVSPGWQHTAAIRSDRTLWTWGRNSNGQLGLGSTVDTWVPVQVAGTGWAAVSTGQFHTVALKSDGSLWTWGSNASGQLGRGPGAAVSSPTRVGADNDWVDVAAGYGHTLALKSDGSLWAWGLNDYGQLGLGDYANRNTPVRVGTANDWIDPAGSSSSSAARKSDGGHWTWGCNNTGQLGRGSLGVASPVATRLGSASDWDSIFADWGFAGGTRDGALWIWGENLNGQLGAGLPMGAGTESTTLRQVPGTDWAAVGAGAQHVVALKQDGTVWTWGDALYGQLGDGTTGPDRNTPRLIGPIATDGFQPVIVDHAAATATGTVTVVFDSYEALDAATVQPADFSIPGLTVSTAVLEADGRTVALQTSRQTPGASYTVTVAGGSIADGVAFHTPGGADGFTGYASYGIASTNINALNSVFSMRGIGNTAYATGMGGYVEKTTNGGATWTRLAARILPSAAQNTGVGNSYDLAFPGGNPNNVVASTYLGIISRSTNGGGSWGYFDNDAVTTAHGIQLDFNSATHGVAVRGTQMLETNDAGVTWARHAQDGTINGVNLRFADSTRGYICGTSGRVYRTDNGGATWYQTSATGLAETLAFVAIDPTDRDTVVVFGANGGIVRTDDGGVTWQVVPSGTSVAHDEAHFVDGSIIFVVGQQGQVMVSRDAGRSWSVIQAANAALPGLGGVWARDASNAWAAGVGGAAYKVTGY